MDTDNICSEVWRWREQGHPWSDIRDELDGLIDEMEQAEKDEANEVAQTGKDYPLGPETTVTVTLKGASGATEKHVVKGHVVVWPGYTDFRLVVHPQVRLGGEIVEGCYGITEPKSGLACAIYGSTPHVAIKNLVTNTITTPEKFRNALNRVTK